MKKKLLSILLSAIFVFSCIPATSFAETERDYTVSQTSVENNCSEDDFSSDNCSNSEDSFKSPAEDSSENEPPQPELGEPHGVVPEEVPDFRKRHYMFGSDTDLSSGRVMTMTVSLTEGCEFWAKFSWRVVGSSDSVNYDIALYSADDMVNPLVQGVVGTDPDTEIIQVTIPTTGRYVIEIYLHESTKVQKLYSLFYDY